MCWATGIYPPTEFSDKSMVGVIHRSLSGLPRLGGDKRFTKVMPVVELGFRR